MAVFFRIFHIDNTIHLEVSILGLRIRVDLKTNTNAVVLLYKNKRKTLFPNSKKLSKNNIKLPDVRNNLVTIIRKHTVIKGCFSGKVFYDNKMLIKKYLILIFGLIKNTGGVFFNENGYFLPIFNLTNKFFLELNFTLKIRLFGIILYFLKILKITRRNKYGSNF